MCGLLEIILFLETKPDWLIN
uniref:Uncharacterized protein n=1 Tax=Nelumbo nucifera TaxID=4432 RepID=A0A822ZFY7_NELNU|nr:TPA_asm: hypothetical protein HUJ06_014871 [Nelumbo nucifera]